MFFSNKHGYLSKGSTPTSGKIQDESSAKKKKTPSQDLDRRIDASIKSIQNMNHMRQQNGSRLGHSKVTEESLEVPKPRSIHQSDEAPDTLKRRNRARRMSVGAIDRESINNNIMTNGNTNRRSGGRRRSIGTTRTTEAALASLEDWANFDDLKNEAEAAPPSRSTRRRAGGNRKATAQAKRAKEGEDTAYRREHTNGHRRQKMSRSPVRRNYQSSQRVPRNRSQSGSDHSRDLAMSPSTPSGRSSSHGGRSAPTEGMPKAPELEGEGNSDAALPEVASKRLTDNSRSEQMQIISWQRVPSVRKNLGAPTGKWGTSVRHIKQSNDDPKLPTAPAGKEDIKDDEVDRSSRSEEMQISWQRVPSVRKNLGAPTGKWGTSVRNIKQNNDDPKLPTTPAGMEDIKDDEADRSSRSEEMQISWQRVPSVRKNLGSSTGEWGTSVRHIKQKADPILPTTPAGMEDIKDDEADRSSRSEEIQISWQRVPSVRKLNVSPPKAPALTIWRNRHPVKAPIPMHNEKTPPKPSSTLKRNHTTGTPSATTKRLSGGSRSAHIRTVVVSDDVMGSPNSLSRRRMRSIQSTAAVDKKKKLSTAPIEQDGDKGDVLDRSTRSAGMDSSIRSTRNSIRLDRSTRSTRNSIEMDHSSRGKRSAGMDSSTRNSIEMDHSTRGKRSAGMDHSTRSKRSAGMDHSTRSRRNSIGMDRSTRGKRSTGMDHSIRSRRNSIGMDHSTRGKRSTEMDHSTRSKRSTGMDHSIRSRRSAGMDNSTRSAGMQITWRREPSVRKNIGNVPMHWYTGKRPARLGKRRPRNRTGSTKNGGMDSPGRSRRERRINHANSSEGEALPLAPSAAIDSDHVSKEGIGEIAKLLERSKKLDKANEWRRVRTKRPGRAQSRRRAKSPSPAPTQHTIPMHWQRNPPNINSKVVW